MNQRPPINLTPVVAATAVMALTFTSIGVLIAARHFQGSGGAATSTTRVDSASPSPTPTTLQLSTPSTNVVWVLANYDHLYRSTDQGAHWEARPLPPRLGVRPAITFMDESEGWLLAPGSPAAQCQEASATLWHTTDGAHTWTQLLVGGFRSAQCKEFVYFTDSRHGYITAWDDNHQPVVYWSWDRGMTWKTFTLPDPPDFKTLPGGFSLRVEWVKSFGRTMYLEAYGSQGPGTPYPDAHDRQYIFVSTDFGTTWAWKQKVASRDMAIVTESRWLEVVSPPMPMDESTNAGQQFHPFASDLNADASGTDGRLVFADSNVGYAARGGLLQRTVDGGSHWTVLVDPAASGTSPVPSSTPAPIVLPTTVQLSAPGRDVVWVLAAGLRLFGSIDRGQTWQERSLPQFSGGPVEVAFSDSDHGWVSECPQTGATLWRSSDGARSWQPVKAVGLATNGCLKDLSFADAAHGFISYWNGAGMPVIYRTSDAGETWVASSLPEPTGFKAGGGTYLEVQSIRTFGAEQLAIAANNVGQMFVFHSTDGGATWTYSVTTPNAWILPTFVTPTRWVQVVAPGRSMESTDGGETWHVYGSDYSQAAPVAPDIVFADPQVGYATVRGLIQQTLDGGLHWKPIQTPGAVQPG